MEVTKQFVNSVILDREAHLDVFELSREAEFLTVLFGGSGIDEDEYDRRSKMIIPVFDSVFTEARIQSIKTVFIHVTAPFDVPLARFPEFPEALQQWNLHVWTELLSAWGNLPVFISSFSGGAALAFNGAHTHPRCIGGAAIAWDALPGSFRRPDHWPAKLQLHAGSEDRVCGHRENQKVAERLIDAGQAELTQYARTDHSIVSYVRNGCIKDLIQYAATLHAGNK